MLTERNMLSVIARSVDMGLKMAVRAAIARIYAAALRQEVDFQITYIPNDFNVPYNGPFDQNYMHKLFDRRLAAGAGAGGGFPERTAYALAASSRGPRFHWGIDRKRRVDPGVGAPFKAAAIADHAPDPRRIPSERSHTFAASR